MKKPILAFLVTSIFLNCSGPEKEVPELIDIVHWMDGKLELPENKVDTFFLLNPTPVINYTQANFFYKGKAHKVQLTGDFCEWSLDSALEFRPLDYGYWHLAHTFDPRAQLEYKLVIDGNQWILDPFNSATSTGGFGVNSLLRMDEFEIPPELEAEPTQLSFRNDEFSLGSRHLDTAIKINIMTPLRDENEIQGPHPLVFFQDGTDYLTLGKYEQVIGNLIEAGTIKPFVGVLVTPFDRTKLYAGELRHAYAEFFTKELLPNILSRLENIDTTASARVIMGSSFGGNASALISLKFPQLFPKCAMHSPAFGVNNYEIHKMIVENDSKKISLSYVWGTYEYLNKDIKAFAKLVDKRGYTQWYKSYPEGHNWIFWRGTYDDLLIPFLPGEGKE